MNLPVKKFLSLPTEEKKLFAEAFIASFISGLLLKLLPFKHITKLYKLPPHSSPLTPHPSPLTPHPSPLTPSLIKIALQRSSRFVPWKNRCLVSSLAARRMLNRRNIPSRIFLGAGPGSGKINAHAWIIAGDFEVVEKGAGFVEIFSF